MSDRTSKCITKLMNSKQDLLLVTQALFPKYILNSTELKYISIIGNINTYNIKQYQLIVPSYYITNIMAILFLHINYQYKSLVDLFGVDYLDKKYRFQIIYQFISYAYFNRIIIKTWTDDLHFIDSITATYPSANWYERECWDMYGVSFKNHPDLRRILTDYGFQGHPFRKDFPLSGFIELRYDERYQRIAYDPIHSIQEFRIFDTLTPWNFYHKN